MEQSANFPLKAVLHAHPHFYGPRFSRDYYPGERLYKKFIPVPTLSEIVTNYISNDIRLGVISSCHLDGEQDNSVEYYISQLKSLEGNFEIDSHYEKEGWIAFYKKSDLSSKPLLILAKSQEVRTKNKGFDADINFIGNPQNIRAGQDTMRTIIEGRNDRVVIICHPGSFVNSLPLEESIELYKRGMVDGIEKFNASDSRKVNMKRLQTIDNSKGVYGISVSDSHYFKPIIAWTSFKENILQNEGHSLDLPNLRNALRTGDFVNYFNYYPRSSVFLTHRLPILMSFLDLKKFKNAIKQFRKK